VIGTEFASGAARETEQEVVTGIQVGHVSVGSCGRLGRWPDADAEPPARGPQGAWARALEARVLALAAAIGLAAVLAVTGCTSTHASQHSDASATLKVKPGVNCTASGCAVARTTVSLPQSTVLYGASCSGIHGSWFFNAIEGGGSSQLRPNHRLQWSFAEGATTARPDGLISVPHTKTTRVTLTLSNGKLTLHGVRNLAAPVTATGTLIVKLSGLASAHSLTFIEKGLSGAEHNLGLVSSFNAGRHPLVVHVKHVKSLTGC
jgi:hypothetical protein